MHDGAQRLLDRVGFGLQPELDARYLIQGLVKKAINPVRANAL